MKLSLVNLKDPILLHNNGWPHVSCLTTQKLFKLDYETHLHPPYSSIDLSTDIYFLDIWSTFWKIKNQKLMANTIVDFVSTKDSKFYSESIEKLLTHCQKCTEVFWLMENILIFYFIFIFQKRKHVLIFRFVSNIWAV